MANALQGAVFVAVGSRLSMRPVWSGDRLAVQAFSTWWFMYGIQGLVTAIRMAAVAGGQRDVDFYMVVFSVELVMAFLALGGLVLYVAYLWHGRYIAPTLLFIVLASVGFLYVVVLQWHGPSQVTVDGFRTGVVFQRPLTMPTRWLLLTGYYGPVLALAGLFGYVATISARPQQRRAIAMALLLMTVAAADVLSLGPVYLGSFAWVPSVLRVAAAGIAGVVFLRAS